MKKFIQNIFSIKNDKRFHKVLTIFGIKLKIKNKDKYLKELENNFNTKLKELEILTTKRIMKTIPFNSLNIIEIHIVDHCNLQCKGCTHFAPLTSESFLNLEEFESDLKKLYEITNGDVQGFHILGGEPLLHPNCIEFLKSARKIFPKSVIELVTNGILLLEQNDEFYKQCRDFDIIIAPTKYNLQIDWELIEKTCNKFDVRLNYFMNSGKIEKTMHKIIFDIKGKQNAKEQFLNCWLTNPGIHFLDHGKLYKCAQAPYIRFFNKAFNLNLEVKQGDYIDIYDNVTLKEILEFLAKPSQFCSYCIKTKNINDLKWSKSEKEITEWIEEPAVATNDAYTERE